MIDHKTGINTIVVLVVNLVTVKNETFVACKTPFHKDSDEYNNSMQMIMPKSYQR